MFLFVTIYRREIQFILSSYSSKFSLQAIYIHQTTKPSLLRTGTLVEDSLTKKIIKQIVSWFKIIKHNGAISIAMPNENMFVNFQTNILHSMIQSSLILLWQMLLIWFLKSFSKSEWIPKWTILWGLQVEDVSFQ